MKKIYQVLLSIIILLGIFMYGIGVGNNQIFPYKIIKKIIHRNWNEKVSIEYMSYAYMKNMYKNIKIDSYITMVGDSITFGIDWTEMFPDIVIVNRSIIGETTKGVQNRLENILSTKPEKVFILLGINDLAEGYSIEEVFGNYKIIVDEIRKNNIEVYVQSILYVQRNNVLSFNNNDKIEIINNKLEKYCIENEITYINLNEEMSVENTLKPNLTIDGVHINARGYLLWKNIITSYIYE